MRHWTETLLHTLKTRYPGVSFTVSKGDDRFFLHFSNDRIELSEVAMRYDPGAWLSRLYQRIEIGRIIQNLAQTLVLKYETNVWWAD